MKRIYPILFAILMQISVNVTKGQGPITPTDMLGRNEILMLWNDGFDEVPNEEVSIKHQIAKLKTDYEKPENKYKEFDKYPVASSPFGSYGNRVMNGAAGDFNGDGLQEYMLVNHLASDSFLIQIPYLDSLSHDSSAIHYFKGPVSVFDEPGLGNVLIQPGNFYPDVAMEAALAFIIDGTIHINIVDVNDSFEMNLKSTISDENLSGYTTQEPLAMTVGNLDNDETDEIIILFRSELPEKGFYAKIYDVEADYTLQPEARMMLNESSGDNPDNTVPGLTIADVNGDSIVEIVCAFVENDPVRSVDTIRLVPVTVADDPLTGEVNPLEKMDYLASDVTSFTFESAPDYVELVSGDVSGDGKDEIFVSINYIILFEHNDDNSLKLEEKDMIYWATPGSLKFYEVSNIDGDGAPELVVGTIISYYDLRVTIYSFDENNEQTKYLEYESDNVNAPYNFIMLTGDFDADRFRIGPGKKYEKTKIIQPMVILNAPPTHFDVFNDSLFDVNFCYGDNNCGSFVDYTTTESQEISVSATLKESYAVAGRVSGGGSFLGAKVDAYIQTEYGQYFEDSKSNTKEVTITQTIRASGDDWLYATVCDYEIWEYPVLNENGAIVDNIITLKPSIKENRWFPSKQQTATGYVPRHEVGNILSYTPFTDLNNPDADKTIWGSYLGDDSYELNNNSKIENTVQFQEIFQSTEAVQRDIAIEVGGSVGGWGIQVDAAARYEGSSLSTHSLTVDKGLKIFFHQLGVNQEIGEVSYRVTPYIYWSNTGALVVDYAVRPSLPSPGFTQTWWSARYDISDPTFILPWKLDPEKGLALEDPVKRKQTKSLSFSHDNPSAGDTITIRASIHNYSPYPTAGKIPVSFYIGDPDKGGTLITDIHGETVFRTSDVIDYQNFQVVQIRWVVPDNLSSFPRIYAVIDPFDEIAEVHETNNVGWTVLGKTDEDGEPTVIQPTWFTDQKTVIYPNPASDFIQMEFETENTTHVNISIYTIHGQLLMSIEEAAIPPGFYEKQINVNSLDKGMYVIVIQAGDFTETHKLLINK